MFYVVCFNAFSSILKGKENIIFLSTPTMMGPAGDLLSGSDFLLYLSHMSGSNFPA